jgi:hypothetical protein
MEILASQGLEEIVKYRVALKPGNVLHGYDIRFQFANESSELRQQSPLWVPFVIKRLRVLRKGDARGTTGKDADMAFGVVPREALP